MAATLNKQSYRYRVKFENFGSGYESGILTSNVVSCIRPSLTFVETAKLNQNDVTNARYIAEWGDITLVVRDDADGKTRKLIGEQLIKQFTAFQDATESPPEYKFNLTIEILDRNDGNDPKVLETWSIIGAFIQTISYGSLAYSSNSPIDNTMIIKFDKASII